MKQRPIIKLTPSKADRLLAVIGWCVVVFLWAVILANYNGLPETIPTHYNGAGEVDGYGGKATIFMMPVMATILFLGMTALNRYPHIFNYPVEITEDNAQQNYTMATRLINIVKTSTVTIFTWIAVKDIQIAKGNSVGLGSWFLPVVLGVMFIPVVVVVVKMFKRG